MLTTLIVYAIAYLIGSISMSIVLAKLQNKPDPRESGSGNAGATNVLRTSGKFDAILVLIGDFLKGFAVVWLAHGAGLSSFAVAIAGFFCVVGHVYPVFFKFKGGKGVATGFGVTFGLSFIAAIVAVFVFVIVLGIKRYVSLASLAGAVITPFVLLFFVNGGYFLPAVLIAALVIYRHLDNISRLKSGTEPKLGSK